MLKAEGMHMNTVAMINSFMSDRTAVVMMVEIRSAEFPIKRGVPQGSKLGPTLYSVYTKDFGIAYNHEQGMAKYADDLLYWCSGKYKPRIVKNAKEGFQKIKVEMEKWGIQINESKTNVMLIPAHTKSARRMAKDIKENGISLDGGAPIYGGDRMKYLGITINPKLNHKYAVSRTGMVYGKLKWIIKKESTSMKVKQLIYKQVIRPNLTYGMQILPITTEKKLKKLGILERKIARVITKKYRRSNGKYYPNKVLYGEMELKKDVVEHINNLKEKYEYKKETHNNEWYRLKMSNLE